MLCVFVNNVSYFRLLNKGFRRASLVGVAMLKNVTEVRGLIWPCRPLLLMNQLASSLFTDLSVVFFVPTVKLHILTVKYVN